MERMKKPKFIKEIEKSEGKERAKCGRWYIRVYGELDHKPMVELESLEIVVKELHKLEEENKKLKMSLEEKDENCYSLARENDQLKLHIEAKDKAYESLLTDYNYLEARIKRMEKKFLEYVENHKKLEDELDEVIMNR